MMQGLGGPTEDANRLFNEMRGLLIRVKNTGKAIPVVFDTYVTKTIPTYLASHKAGKTTAEQYNTQVKRLYDYVVPKLRAIETGELTITTATPAGGTTSVINTVTEGEFNVLGVGINKKWVVYGGVALVALIGLSFLKGKK